MNRVYWNTAKTGMILLALAAMLAACGTRPAPNFRGKWRPVNHYTQVPEEIPLYEAYVYQPAPLDGTLKTMLTRWAKDKKMNLSYLAASDYTLHAPVAGISTPNLQQALGQLNQAYAPQGLSLVHTGNQIIVRSGPAR